MPWRPPARSPQTMAEAANRFPKDMVHDIPYDTTEFVEEFIIEVVKTLGDRDRARHLRRFRFPGRLAGHAHPHGDHSGFADRRAAHPQRARVLHQHDHAVRSAPGHRDRRGRRHRRHRKRAAPDRRGHGAEAGGDRDHAAGDRTGHRHHRRAARRVRSRSASCPGLPGSSISSSPSPSPPPSRSPR